MSEESKKRLALRISALCVFLGTNQGHAAESVDHKGFKISRDIPVVSIDPDLVSGQTCGNSWCDFRDWNDHSGSSWINWDNWDNANRDPNRFKPLDPLFDPRPDLEKIKELEKLKEIDKFKNPSLKV